jgi:AGCS family alanine or glycine:cation symporter
LSWSLYGTRCFEFLFGTKATRVYQIVFILVIVVGATLNMQLVWDIADTLNGLMAIPNLVALLGLSGVVIRLTKEHFAAEKLQ